VVITRKQRTEEDLVTACCIPPLEKAQKQGKCHYPLSVPSIHKCRIWMV